MVRSSSAGGDAVGTQQLGRTVEALINLGFSQYEARTYAGLVGRPPLTGYAVAKDTQVPQPKVYETLGRLVERGAVVRVSESPAKFIAVPPDRLLTQLEADFRQRMSTAELEISRLRPGDENLQFLRPYPAATTWTAIAGAARALVERCDTHLYVSGHAEHLEAIATEIEAVDRRGVRTDTICFGEPTFDVVNGSVIRHSSTDHMIYPHHQARHLAIVCGSSASLWALAGDGSTWEGIWTKDDPLLTAVVKGFIRHDIFAQRMFSDFSAEMLARYGGGLEGLFEWHSNRTQQPVERRDTGGPGQGRLVHPA